MLRTSRILRENRRRKSGWRGAGGMRISGEAAWRLLTGARYDPGQMQLSGDPALAEPLLQVRGIIV